MAKKVLLVTPCNEKSGCSDCDFKLTDDQMIDLQRIYGADGEVQIKTVSCDEVPCWYELICAGDDCDILAVCPCLIQDMFTHSFVDIILDNSKPIITFLEGNWLEVSVTKL